MEAYRSREGSHDPCVAYKAQCACTSDADIMNIWFERDEECPDEIAMTFYYEVHNYFHTFYGERQFWCNLWKRIKTSLKVLFGGRLEIEGAFLLRGEKQMADFIAALNEGREFVKKAESEGRAG
jgi:hypothetical protein